MLLLCGTVVKVKFCLTDPGMHVMRHFYASWSINRQEDGGLELPAKVVQERLGHSSINQTMDVYGHLFASRLQMVPPIHRN